MVRKPTRRGIRRRATRNRSGGTVYQNDTRLNGAVGGLPATDQRHVDLGTSVPLSQAEVAQALVELLDRCGWKRLEVCRGSRKGVVSGYCVDGNGDHLHLADLL